MYPKRKRDFDTMEQICVKRKRTKPRIKLIDAPPVHSIKDLIEISKAFKFFKNLDTIMLWRIAPYLEQLDEMIGMESLKETIFYQVVYYLQGMHKKNIEQEYLHTVIYGPPGSGKTTVAKIIGKLYRAMNVLSDSGVFKIAYRDDFVAGYLGQTAIKTKKLLKSCIGGVLFIDEVYSLAPRNKDKDSFSKEAIDTLTGFLSEHKNDFCCIIAGYEEEIKNCFFAMNRGLNRRFPWVHKIEDYTSKDLHDIFVNMIEKMNWKYAFSSENVIKLFEINKDMFKITGGDIETFLSKCKMIHSRRVFSMGNEHKFVLTMSDLNNAMEFLKKNNNNEKDDEYPMAMYM